ncbi:MAG: DUF3276 family protein [Alistipes sp.]|nr:DUF3276 family protein [Alistipes sp.]MBR2170636.1 DUF3276 family protein [Alistipes sp.]MBR2331665.1 DUF3276 family protein [Alistipes sp.]MBR6661948.1 DUF3276 family protein [Alistipes sp.]
MTPEFLQVDADCSDAYEKSVYTKMVRAGHRTYFIDVKQTRSEKYFMCITELRRKVTDSGVVNERSKVHIYEEDFDKFINGFGEVLDYVKGLVEKP